VFERIKIFFKGRALLNEATKEVKMDNQVKPGWKTTEFWGKNLAQLVALGAMVAALKGHNVTPEQQQVIVQAGITVIGGLEGLYMGFRSLVKFVKDWKAAQQPQPAATPATPPAQPS